MSSRFGISPRTSLERCFHAAVNAVLISLQEILCGELGLHFDELGEELEERKQFNEAFVILIIIKVSADYAVAFLTLDDVTESVVDENCGGNEENLVWCEKGGRGGGEGKESERQKQWRQHGKRH